MLISLVLVSTVRLGTFLPQAAPNALAEYQRAGMMLNDSSYRVFQNWLPPDKRPTPEQIHMAEEARKKLLASMTPEERRNAEHEALRLSAEDQQLADHLNGLTYLQTRQEEIARFQPSLELLEQASREPFEYVGIPPERPDREQSDVVSSVRKLTDLAADASFVSFAAGQSSRAVEVLDEALIMCHRLGQCGVPSRLAAANLSSTLLRAFNDNLGSLTLEDAKRIASLAEGMLGDREAFASLVKNEKRRLSGWIDQAFGADGSGSLGRQSDGSLPRQFLSLSPDLRAGFVKKLHALVDDRMDSLSQRLDSPEENWLSVMEPEAPTPEPKSLEELEAALAKALTAGLDHRFMLAVVRSRTQLRLLDLHARIISFRWETGRLPTTLDELRLPHDSIFDPLSRRLFGYQTLDAGYKLWSVGIPETGPIELKYQPPADEAHDPDRP